MKISLFRCRVARVPVTMQMETMECGAACLRMVLASFGKYVSLACLRTVCGTGRSGTGIKRLMKSAIHYGLKCDAYEMQADALRKEESFPIILFWNQSHYVVLCGFSHGKAVINDPAQGQVRVEKEEFDKNFSGIAITFEKGNDFVPDGKRPEILDLIKNKIRGAKAAIVFVALMTVFNLLVGFLQPGFSRLFLDRMLNPLYGEWLPAFLLSFLFIAGIQVFTGIVNSRYWLRIQGKLAVTASATYMWHVLRLPMEFFQQRQTGDILMRGKSNESLAATLISHIAPMIPNALLVVLYLVVMTRYSVILTVSGLFLLLIEIVISVVAARVRVNDARAAVKLSAQQYGTTVSGIGMVESLKACGAENHYFGRWIARQSAANRQNVANTVRSLNLSAVSEFVQSFSNIFVLIAGMYLMTKGSFTAGILMAFQSLMQSMIVPAGSLISARQGLKEMETDSERVDDVMEYPEQPSLRDDAHGDTRPLAGDISVRCVSFSYSPTDRKTLKNISLGIKKGERIALVGPSGCGKSTLCKLLTGLYEQTEGEILFDGRPIGSIDRHVLCDGMAVVEPEGVLFRDTVLNNLTMWDDTIDSARVIAAAKAALIHDDIMKKPDGYAHMMSAGGADFSGGQRQRLAIARALLRQPAVLVLDEATSALDANTEEAVMKNIFSLGITCIVVAHRLSTIRNCDRILVFDAGAIVQEGDHDALMTQDGLYRSLVESM